LVVEEKGIYSIEKFLIARRLMYWQVYLHKTVLAAEQMLVQIFRRAKDLRRMGRILNAPLNLQVFLDQDLSDEDFLQRDNTLLEQFAALDDFDVFSAVKYWMHAEDLVLAYLSRSLVERRLFKLEFSNQAFDADLIEQRRAAIAAWWKGEDKDLTYFVLSGQESNKAYNALEEEIKILFKPDRVRPMSEIIEEGLHSRNVVKYYLCYPKI
jgi:uncharacterized protein